VKKKSAPSHSKRWLIAGLIAGVILALAILPTAHKPTPPTIPSSPITNPSKKQLFISESEGVELINSLLQAITPSNSENSYMTPFMKGKINWVFTGIQEKHISFHPFGTLFRNADGTENEAELMSSGYVSKNNDGKPPYMPQIQLSVPRLYIMVRIQQKVLTGFNQMMKNTFALTLIHEAVHLELSEEHYILPRSSQATLDEEVRAWYEVDTKAVKQLRAIGQPLDIDFITVDDILQRCGYNRNCPRLVEYLQGTGKIPH